MFKNVRYGTVKTILEQNIDKEPLVRINKDATAVILHENIRGESFFLDNTNTEKGVEECI